MCQLRKEAIVQGWLAPTVWPPRGVEGAGGDLLGRAGERSRAAVTFAVNAMQPVRRVCWPIRVQVHFPIFIPA